MIYFGGYQDNDRGLLVEQQAHKKNMLQVVLVFMGNCLVYWEASQSRREGDHVGSGCTWAFVKAATLPKETLGVCRKSNLHS